MPAHKQGPGRVHGPFHPSLHTHPGGSSHTRAHRSQSWEWASVHDGRGAQASVWCALRSREEMQAVSAHRGKVSELHYKVCTGGGEVGGGRATRGAEFFLLLTHIDTSGRNNAHRMGPL